MSIIVLGKTGQIASYLSNFKNVISLGRSQLDFLKDDIFAKLQSILKYKPRVIINCVSYNNVNDASKETIQAEAINIDAVKKISLFCQKNSIHFVHISSDFIFSGEGDKPWDVNDTPSPVNYYGKTKLSGEDAVMKSNCSYTIIRTSWVFSDIGNNFMKKIYTLIKSQHHKSINVVDDQVGGPTPASEIAKFLYDISCSHISGNNIKGVYHYCGLPFVSRADIAQEICEKLNSDTRIIKTESNNINDIMRPKNSRLDVDLTKKFFCIEMPRWPVYIEKYIHKLESINKL